MRISITFLFTLMLLTSCVKDTFMEDDQTYSNPSGLTYMNVTNGREGKTIISTTPSVSTGNLIPYFEIINGFDKDGNILDDSFMKFVSISNPVTSEWKLEDKEEYPTNAEGELVTGGTNVDLSMAGVITIADGNNFTVGDYYFTVKVTTSTNGQTYSTVFDKAFHIQIEPLLPSYLVYQLKTQNLVYGNSDSKTNAPLIPVGNKDVRFSLESNLDKLSINPSTGVVSLSSSYGYNGYDTIRPTIKVTSNISEESVSFSNSLVVIVTNTPEVMPVESIYFFYPMLSTTGTYPTGGDGFSVQTLIKGNCTRIWGQQTNSVGGSLVAPEERPATNKSEKPIEAATFGTTTVPTSFWCIMTPQDLSVYNLGYKISVGYYYMPAYQTYMTDGRTPTDLEVYVSTNYTGGTVQNTDGTWTANGTWTQINSEITCNISLGTVSGKSSGAPWGNAFVGTPYPGDQKGEDPEGRKDLARGTVYGKWIKCSYDITKYKECKTFTVAFKVASYFTGELFNNTTVPGRGGSYFISDFHFVATEVAP